MPENMNLRKRNGINIDVSTGMVEQYPSGGTGERDGL